MATRHAKRSDIPSMIALARASFAAEILDGHELYEQALDQGLSYVAEESGNVVGYIVAYWWHTLFEPPFVHHPLAGHGERACIYIHELVVSKSHAGRGIAGELMARLRGRTTAPMTIVSVNGTQGFWERMGFCKAACSQDRLDSYCGGAVFMIAHAS